ncbi:MAG: hypothetical protein ABFC77_03000 [Thermoguttaceae bacterium]
MAIGDWNALPWHNTGGIEQLVAAPLRGVATESKASSNAAVHLGALSYMTDGPLLLWTAKSPSTGIDSKWRAKVPPIVLEHAGTPISSLYRPVFFHDAVTSRGEPCHVRASPSSITATITSEVMLNAGRRNSTRVLSPRSRSKPAVAQWNKE